jgi:hypothetical protein
MERRFSGANLSVDLIAGHVGYTGTICFFLSTIAIFY